MKKILVFLFISGFLGVASNATADKAVFAGGCFWCMESDFEKLKGVSNVVSGFTGGSLKNPTYRGNHKGHYEAIEVTYNPEKVSYADLLEHYWVNVDPFDARGQFCDKGFSLRFTLSKVKKVTIRTMLKIIPFATNTTAGIVDVINV